MPVAHGISVVIPRRNAAPVVDRMAVDLRRHTVLESQAYELNAVLPTEALFHQLSHPAYDGAFTSAREPVHNVQKRLSWALVDRALLLFKPLKLQSLNKVLEKLVLLFVGFHGARHDGRQHTVYTLPAIANRVERRCSIALLVERRFLRILATTGRGQRCEMLLMRLLEHVPRAASVAGLHHRRGRLPHSLPDAMALFIFLESSAFLRRAERRRSHRDAALVAEAVNFPGRFQ